MSLLKENDLSAAPSGIYVTRDPATFEYSDGETVEAHIKEALSRTSDLSSYSAELQRNVVDWPSEYHLSGKRANLLRALNLSSGQRVLELGCGCGAITRFLSEQGMVVDAVEGSRARAELAQMRCVGLDGVNIVCANFNQLQLPRNHYDAVLFVGVVEYAARFWPDDIDEEQAVTHMLDNAKDCLTPSGVIIVGIENRTGMKYVLGAHADHYSKRYVGIHNYPHKAGIKTYTRAEWEGLIDAAGIKCSRFIYPFPDYKVPTVLLADKYADANRYAYNHLEGLKSRDYVMPFDLGVHEPVFWEAVGTTGTFGAFANSFLIVMGNDEAAVGRTCDFDFAHLPDFSRAPKYALIAMKKAGANEVTRERLLANDEIATNSNGVSQVVAQDPYWAGNLLSVDWSRSVLIDPWGNGLKEYLTEYYTFLCSQTLTIDLLPTNIVVGRSGEYHVFDQEWQVEWELTPGYVFFRALFSFSLRHRATLKEFARRNGLYTTRDFLQFGFWSIGIDPRPCLSEYLILEQAFQAEVNADHRRATADTLIDARLVEEDWDKPVYARVYWRVRDQAYSEERSVTIGHDAGDAEFATLRFELPVTAGAVSHVRIDPCDERRMDDIGFIELRNVCCSVVLKETGSIEAILALHAPPDIAAAATMSGIVYAQESYGQVFAVTDDNPELEFELPPTAAATIINYIVAFDIRHRRSAEYSLIRDRFLVEESILQSRIRNLEYGVNETARLRLEIETMKRSLFWRIGAVVRTVLKRTGE